MTGDSARAAVGTRTGDDNPAPGAPCHGERAVLLLMGCALLCAFLSLAFGALGAIYYIKPIAVGMQSLGLSLAQLRPLHTTFASAWIFLGAVSCVMRFLYQDSGEPTASERFRFRAQMICWGLAGLGALFTLPFGITRLPVSASILRNFQSPFSMFLCCSISFALTRRPGL